MVANRERPVQGSSRLVLAHFWAAFAVFAVAIPLGAWQMLVRSPLHRWIDPETVLPRRHGAWHHARLRLPDADCDGLRLCGLRGIARPADARLAACLGVVLAGDRGAAMALATVAAGKATVLYTFYPPLLGSPFYYLGILIAVIGSWIWIGLMVSHFRRWKRDHPGPAGSAGDVCHHRRRAALGAGPHSASARRSCS